MTFYFMLAGELGDMRQQMKSLEQKNEMYMQQTISLEEDSKRANALKNQVKKQTISLEEDSKRANALKNKLKKTDF